MLFTCQPEEASLMSETPASDVPPEGSHQARNAVVAIIVVILLLTAGLVAIAAVLAAHADTAGPSVRVIRDLLIIVMALEMVVIGAAFVVLLVQVARFINLINNELQPLITATSDTVNTVRGTAVFSKQESGRANYRRQQRSAGCGKSGGRCRCNPEGGRDRRRRSGRDYICYDNSYSLTSICWN
jgi:hypothetical protein